MPAVPLPPIPDIQQAHWGDAQSNPAAVTAGANAVGAPVNPTMSGLAQASQQAQQALQGAQAKSALTDVQQKQRGMQASMLGALANLSPEDYAAKAPTVIGSVNKIGGLQYNTGMDQATARMNAMFGVPVQEQPIYGLNQHIPDVMRALTGESPSQNGAGQPGQPSNPSTPFQVDPKALLTASTIPGLKPMVDTALKIQEVNQNSPTGKNVAEANKNSIESVEGYNQVKASLGSLKDIIGKTDENGKFIPNEDLPQTRGLLSAEQRAGMEQRLGAPAGQEPNFFGSQKGANDYKTFNLLNSSQTLKAIQSLAASGQIKPTKTLESIIDRGYLVDPEAAPEEKWREANVVQKELENSAVAAQNIAKTMGGGQTQEMTKPVTAAGQAQSKLQPKQSNVAPEGTTVKNAQGQTMVKRNGQWTLQ